MESQKAAEKRAKKYASMKETKGVMFPSNKKLFEVNMFQNSEEFKQLGTIHKENRAADYYPLDKPQPTSIQPSPLSKLAGKISGEPITR
jgi:hypothetical protein